MRCVFGFGFGSVKCCMYQQSLLYTEPKPDYVFLTEVSFCLHFSSSASRCCCTLLAKCMWSAHRLENRRLRCIILLTVVRGTNVTKTSKSWSSWKNSQFNRMRRQESIGHGLVVKREGRGDIKRKDKTEGPVSADSKQPRLFKKIFFFKKLID